MDYSTCPQLPCDSAMFDYADNTSEFPIMWRQKCYWS